MAVQLQSTKLVGTEENVLPGNWKLFSVVRGCENSVVRGCEDKMIQIRNA